MDVPEDAVLAGLRASDRVRYAASLYAPPAKRPSIAALHAFDAEIAGIHRRVSEPPPGEIRIQWWRDAIAGTSEGASGNPLARALRGVMAQNALPAAAFERYLDARIADLYADAFPDLTSLEAHFGDTAGTILQCAVLVLDREAAPAHADASGHAACVVGAAELVMRLPADRARRRCVLPRDMLEACGTSPERFWDEADDKRLAAVAALAALGGEHHAAFSRVAASMPAALRPAYLLEPVAAALMRRAAADPRRALAQPMTVTPLRANWIMLRHFIAGWRR